MGKYRHLICYQWSKNNSWGHGNVDYTTPWKQPTLKDIHEIERQISELENSNTSGA